MIKLQLAVLGSSLDTYANRFWTQVARMQTRHIPKPIISFLYRANELSQGFPSLNRWALAFRFASLAVAILYHGLLVLRKNTNFSVLLGIVKTT